MGEEPRGFRVSLPGGSIGGVRPRQQSHQFAAAGIGLDEGVLISAEVPDIRQFDTVDDSVKNGPGAGGSGQLLHIDMQTRVKRGPPEELLAFGKAVVGEDPPAAFDLP